MNLNNLSSSDFPFKHWEIANCLDDKALNEISYSSIPQGNLGSAQCPSLTDYADSVDTIAFLQNL